MAFEWVKLYSKCKLLNLSEVALFVDVASCKAVDGRKSFLKHSSFTIRICSKHSSSYKGHFRPHKVSENK